MMSFKSYFGFAILFLFEFGIVFSQKSASLLDPDNVMPVNVEISSVVYEGKKAMFVQPLQVESEAKFVKLKEIEFENGIIELDLAGSPSATAGAQARGFVGVCFRIDSDNSKFECFYLRPTNGRAEDQLRRNHSAQYISYPDFPWFKLRKETPGKYESYVDLVPGQWTKVKISVQGTTAKLFVHGNEQPTLIVNDLKHGAGTKGSVGLWVGPGTDGHFANVHIKNQ